MQTNIEKGIGDPLIFQVRDLTKYYKCEEEEDNRINIIHFLKRKEDLGIKNVSFDVYKNKIIGLIGKKKCGKSTLLKVLSGVLKPSSGKILYKGSKMTNQELREVVSYVSKEQPSCQEFSCTLLENIIQYACRDNKNRCDVVDKAEKLINEFGMDEYKYKEVIKLPNAIRSKMFIIRGLLSHKAFLCFDMPYLYIEKEYREIFNKHLEELAKAGKSIILSSDEENEIEKTCDEFIYL